MQPLLELAERLAPNSKVRQSVAVALADPAGHARAHAGKDRFRFPVPEGKVAWLVLVDALIDAGRACEVDWRADREELVASLRPLLPKSVKLTARELPDQAAWSILALVKRKLAAHKLVLLTMNIDSDSYPLIVAERKQVATLVGLARDAGHDLTTVYPQPPAREKSAWEELMEISGGADDDPIVILRGLERAHQKEVRAALPSAPASARPYLQAYLEISEKDCVAAARASKTPRPFLAVLALFDHERKRPAPGRRQLAADLLATRLKLKPRSEALHDFISSCWVVDDRDLRQFNALPAPARTRLSRLADEVYLANRKQPLIEDWEYLPYKLLAFVGDRESWRLLDENEPKNRRGRFLSADALTTQQWMVKRMGKAALR